MRSPADGDDSADADLVDPIEVLADGDGETVTTAKGRVEAALRSVVDPCSAANGTNLDIVEMGLVDDVRVVDGHVTVNLLLTTPACDMVLYFHEAVEEHVGALDGIDSVEVQTDHGFEWTSDMMTGAAKRRRAAVRKASAERHRKKRIDSKNRSAE